MLKRIQSILLPSLLLANFAFVSFALAQPTNIQLEYEVSRNGKSFGTVKESYVQEG